MQEILHDKILDDLFDILHVIIVQLSQVISVLLLCHGKTFEVISARIIDQAR